MSLNSKHLLVACIIALLVCCGTPAFAQLLSGTVVGVVQDSSGGAVSGALVTLTNVNTAQSLEAKTDDAGRYTLSNVSPGTYSLKVTQKGFKVETITDIQVSANTVTRVDRQLEVGSLAEQITVEASATELQTDKADTHTELGSKDVANMPLPGYRNYQTLMNLVPGATPAALQNSVTDTPGRSLTTNINGTNRNNNMTRIDGASSVNLWLPHHAGYVMPAEMVDTVNITTSAGSAEQGMAGGAAIAVITKSGTNTFHGSLFEYHDDQHLKARNFFQAAGTDMPISIYNNYGGTIGGPIKKNKLFFFYSFDGTRQRQGTNGTWSVPLPDLKAGNFATTGTTIYDPMTGNTDGTNRTPFAGNLIPANRISAAALKVQSYFPDPNAAGSLNNWVGSEVPVFNRDYNDVKMNYAETDKQNWFMHYGIMKALSGGHGMWGDAIGPSGSSDPGVGNTRVMNMSLGQNHTFSPTLLLDSIIGYQRMDQTVLGEGAGTNFSPLLGIPGVSGTGAASGFPNINIGSFQGFGVPGWMPAYRTEESYTMSHNLSWLKGAHSFRFGFDGVNHRMSHYQPELGAGPRGALTFSGNTTALAPNGSPDTNNAYASFLLGNVDNMQKSMQYILMTPREFQFGGYAQDRWQITQKLTFSLGLRYELYPLMTRADDKGIERLDPATELVYMGGRGGIPKNVGVTVSHKLFAPKAGIAYRLDDKTVIRAGYGINYDPLPFSRPLRGFYPLTVNFNIQSPSGFQDAGTLANGMPPVYGPDLSTGIVTLPSVADMRSPWPGEIHRGYVQSYNLTVERKLPQDVVLSVAYVGTESTHLLADRDINTSAPGTGQAGQPYYILNGRTDATNMWDGYLSSNYNSLQMAFHKQLSKGLLLKGSYTWSKAMDMADDDGWTGVGWNYGPVFSRNRAPAGFDHTHIFNVGWVYELPFGKNGMFFKSGVASKVFGGWNVNGVMACYTGSPFTVGADGSSLNSVDNTQTAMQVKSSVAYLHGVGSTGTWFDTTAFAPVTTAATWGSSGRNLLRTPGVWNTDLMINRKFQITEKIDTDFRAEFYNLPNTSHFNGPDSYVNDSTFGQISSSFGERQIRFGLRLGF
jgi:hypothetical protein